MEQKKIINKYMNMSFVQIKDDAWSFAPQKNIYLIQKRMENYIKNNDLKKKLLNFDNYVKPIRFDWNNYQCEILMSAEKDNGGEIFYLYYNEKYLWAYIIGKELRQDILHLTLEIDLIASFMKEINDGGLNGQVVVERGHLITKEKNTIHSDECSRVENLEIVNKDSDIMIDHEPQIFTFSTNDIGRDVEITVSDTTDVGNIKIKKLGSMMVKNGKMIGFTPLTKGELSILNFDSTLPNIKDFLRDSNGIDWFKNEWYVREGGGLINFYNIIHDYPNREKRMKMKKLYDFLINDASFKWYCFPKIFKNIEDNILSDFEIDLKKVLKNINIKKSNHLLSHYNIKICIGSLIILQFNPFFLKDEKIYGIRTINEDNISFSFYYSEKKIEPFSTIQISCDQGLITDKYTDFLKNKSVSYDAGWKTDLGLDTTNLVGNSIIGFVGGSKLGIASVISSVVNLGFNSISSAIKRHYQEQDLRKQRIESRNIPSYEAIYKISLNSFQTWDIFSGFYGDGYFMNLFNYYVSQSSTSDFNDFISFIIEKPQIQDEENIVLEQRLKGNIVANSLFLKNPLEIPEGKKDFIYFSGAVSTFKNDKFTEKQIELINNKLIKGVVILIENDEWK